MELEQQSFKHYTWFVPLPVNVSTAEDNGHATTSNSPATSSAARLALTTAKHYGSPPGFVFRFIFYSEANINVNKSLTCFEQYNMLRYVYENCNNTLAFPETLLALIIPH